MNLKQFLKPDWRKIVLFLILFMILIFLELTILSCFGGINCNLINLGTVSYQIPFTCINVCVSPNLVNLYKSIFYLSFSIIIYFLSYFIVWIYDIYFKKVNKE